MAEQIPSTAKALRDQILGLRGELNRLRLHYLGIFLGGALGLSIAVTAALFVFYPYMDAIFPLAVTLPLLLSFALFRVVQNFYDKAARRHVIEALTLTSGFSYHPEGTIGRDAIIPHTILPIHKEAVMKDGFDGSYNGAPLTLQNIRLEGPPVPVGGLLARIKLKRPVDGHSVVMTSNAARAFFSDKFADYGKVGVPSKYDRQLETFATERAEARLILDGPFVERFMEAGTVLKARWIAASFQKTEIMIFLDRSAPLLRIPPLWSPVKGDALLTLYTQFETFFKLIDVLKHNGQVSV